MLETGAQRPRRNSAPREAPETRPSSELVIGRHPVLEALRSGRKLNRIMLTEGGHGPAHTEIVRLAAERSIAVVKVPRERLDGLADHHQGVIADAAPFVYADLDQIVATISQQVAEQPPLVLALDAIQDPQNFGSLLRTALAVGAIGAILPQRRAVGVTPAVGRASAGAIEHLQIARVGNLVRALDELKKAGCWVVGLDAEATSTYEQLDLTVPMVLVVGSEGGGLGRLVAEHCDLLARLPMVGPLDSLNAAVAGSVVLYEALRQRREKLGV